MPVAWIDADDVKLAAGIGPADAADDEWLARIAAAANDWCSDQRAAAGWADDLTDGAPAPSARAHEGTTLFALSVYRERGTSGGAAGFDELGSFEPPGPTMVRIRQLLGIPRPAFG